MPARFPPLIFTSISVESTCSEVIFNPSFVPVKLPLSMFTVPFFTNNEAASGDSDVNVPFLMFNVP